MTISLYRNFLPQLDGSLFLTDGGLETTLLFHHGIALPCFAAFPLLRDEVGRIALRRYFEPYLRTAAKRRVGFILDTPTWRANPEWAARLGYGRDDLVAINCEAVEWAVDLRNAFTSPVTPIVINGVIGPRGDGYRPDAQMSIPEAADYHALQIDAFRRAGADMASAVTMNYPEEAAGIAVASREARLPVAISFTVETDGRLASGESLGEAIETVEQASDGWPAYFMINCAHPSHFDSVLAAGGAWMQRIMGVRANASAKSHAELDEAQELDIGDPADLARHYRELRSRLPNLSILGGCCGTDHRHVDAICGACMPVLERA